MKFFFLALMLLTFAPAAAQAKDLQIELVSDRIDITTGFNGAKVVLFGTTDIKDADLVVTVKGPERTVKVRRKDQILGAWINNKTIEFRRVPSYYDFAASTKLAFLKENGIGVDNLDFYPEDEQESPETIDIFRDALIRSMQEKGFYPLKMHELNFIDKGFFKVTFDLPPSVPTGIYTIESLLSKDGKLLSHETKTLQVGQVGFNAHVYTFSKNYGFLYGLLAILIASLAGWSAFTFLRRD